LALALGALVDELLVDGRQILTALRTPVLGLCETCTHQERVTFRGIGCAFPRAAGGFQPCFPGQEFALGSNPIAQLAPSPEDRLMRQLGVGLPALGCYGDEKTVRVIG